MWLISEIDDERVLRDEVDWVRDVDEWEETAEVVECQDETMDGALGRGGWPALVASDNPMKWSEVCDTGDMGDSGSSRSFSCGMFGTHTRVCSFFQVLYLRPAVTNYSSV